MFIFRCHISRDESGIIKHLALGKETKCACVCDFVCACVSVSVFVFVRVCFRFLFVFVYLKYTKSTYADHSICLYH